ncbi:unnamed protein product [Calypogeia fissa]
MGIIRSSLSFTLGTLFGVYVAQNYNVPNIQTLFNTGYSVAKHMEEQYRKPAERLASVVVVPRQFAPRYGALSLARVLRYFGMWT